MTPFLIGSGGDLKAAVVGGLTGAAFAGIGDKFAKFKDLDTVQKMEKIALHGLTGGASSVANGGKFGAGFMSAGFTQAMSVREKKREKGSNRFFNNIRSATFFKCLDQND